MPQHSLSGHNTNDTVQLGRQQWLMNLTLIRGSLVGLEWITGHGSWISPDITDHRITDIMDHGSRITVITVIKDHGSCRGRVMIQIHWINAQ